MNEQQEKLGFAAAERLRDKYEASSGRKTKGSSVKDTADILAILDLVDGLKEENKKLKGNAPGQ